MQVWRGRPSELETESIALEDYVFCMGPDLFLKTVSTLQEPRERSSDLSIIRPNNGTASIGVASHGRNINPRCVSVTKEPPLSYTRIIHYDCGRQCEHDRDSHGYWNQDGD